jgi:hypothetical protein
MTGRINQIILHCERTLSLDIRFILNTIEAFAFFLYGILPILFCTLESRILNVTRWYKMLKCLGLLLFTLKSLMFSLNSKKHDVANAMFLLLFRNSSRNA